MAFESNFKVPRSGKIERFKRRAEAKSKEDAEKRKVRLRDKRCRFPLCGCQKYHLVNHVSHSRHKGMGGNPKGDRSDASLMVYVCAWRHKEGRIAIDRGTAKWEALTTEGANGPIEWFVDAEAMAIDHRNAPADGWISVAIEVSRGVIKPPDPWERAILLKLAEMSC